MSAEQGARCPQCGNPETHPDVLRKALEAQEKEATARARQRIAERRAAREAQPMKLTISLTTDDGRPMDSHTIDLSPTDVNNIHAQRFDLSVVGWAKACLENDLEDIATSLQQQEQQDIGGGYTPDPRD